MSKPLPNIYPNLRGQMARKEDTVEVLTPLLRLSPESIRRRLKGKKSWELPELITLANRYEVDIETLFSTSAKPPESG